MEEKIFALAKALGQVGAGDEPALRHLCPGAEAELMQKLRPGISAEDCGAVFLLGAAWLALAALAAAQDDGMQRTTAGDVTIQRGDAAAHCATLRRQSAQLMAPYTTDEGFCFRGVRG